MGPCECFTKIVKFCGQCEDYPAILTMRFSASKGPRVSRTRQTSFIADHGSHNMSNLSSRIDSHEVLSYFESLSAYLSNTTTTLNSGESVELADAFNQIISDARSAHASGNKLIFVGNGGSAAIASHMATDYSKNGNIRALALNDSSMLTCLGNDLGYDQVFAKQIELHARRGDILIAISSSGRSSNILNAVKAARTAGCKVVTFSGFGAENQLRSLGDTNFYISSDRYGFVEIGHLTLCHAILDFICGLRATDGPVRNAPVVA
jgi:D-sedoheptulose 7-phosphate isomerase